MRCVCLLTALFRPASPALWFLLTARDPNDPPNRQARRLGDEVARPSTRAQSGLIRGAARARYAK